MRGKFVLVLTALTIFVLSCAKSHAETISFIYEGTGVSGNIGGVADTNGALVGGTNFSNADFTITAVGDTDNVTLFSDGAYINHQSVSIEIDGVGTFDFLASTPTATFVNNANQRVGFIETVSNRDLSTGPTHGAFSGWNMSTEIGPISGNSGELDQWGVVGLNGADATVETSGGRLIFTDQVNVSVVFTAIFGAPEPDPLLGDVNLDGAANFLDIAPFISLLTNGVYQAEADVDQNGAVNFLDIAHLIAIFSSQ